MMGTPVGLLQTAHCIVGLTQKFCLVDAYVGGTFRKLSYRDEVRERNVIGN